MAYDVSHDDPIAIQPAVSRALSDLADAALESALAIAQSNTEESELLRFTIIGMGKLGAQELNYVSDVDLIYVVEPMAETMSQPQLVKVGSKIAMLMQKICQSVIDVYKRQLAACKDKRHALLVLGHEPTVSLASQWLAGEQSDPGQLDLLNLGMSTAGVAIFGSNAPFRKWGTHEANLIAVLTPKEFEK